MENDRCMYLIAYKRVSSCTHVFVCVCADFLCVFAFKCACVCDSRIVPVHFQRETMAADGQCLYAAKPSRAGGCDCLPDLDRCEGPGVMMATQ